jgi:hypothetical protein
MLNETHRAPPRYKISDFFSSLLEDWSVVIPALGLAEQDRHRNELDEETTDFICQSAREMVEELGDNSLQWLDVFETACPGTQAEHCHLPMALRRGYRESGDSVKTGRWPPIVHDPAASFEVHRTGLGEEWHSRAASLNPDTPFWLHLYVLLPIAHYFLDTPLSSLGTYLCFSRPPEW